MPAKPANRPLDGTRFTDVRRVAQTGSTNADLLALARAGASEGAVLVADHQTAGRGRAGRTWTAPAGSSLLVSVLLRPPPARAALSGMAMGVAVVDAIAATTGVAARLKWPNDIVWPGHGDTSDRKLGGILAEADWSAPDRPGVVVGLGLNLNWPPDLSEDLRAIATSLNHVTGRPADRDEVLVAILRSLDRWVDDPALLDAVRAKSATLGSRVRVHRARDTVEGVAAAITDDGHLIVLSDAGARHDVTVGDVVHVRPA